MTSCHDITAQLAFYLDGELHDADRERVERHVLECKSCRARLDVERAFLESIRSAAPIHTARPELVEDVERILSSAPDAHTAPESLRQKVQHIVLREQRRFGPQRMAAIIAASVVILLGIVVAWRAFVDSPALPGPPSAFALMAVDVHNRHARGNLPLEIASASPEAISTWFAGKVSFGLQLPNYQEASGQDRLYELKGARLVGYNNDYAAYVAYQMGTRPISLVVTSASVASPSGGEQIVSKGLRFHFDIIDGLKVITWSDRGLTYALVSDLEARGQQSCVVCHQGTKDAGFLEF